MKYFGNWAEFKRQAEVIPSRYENQIRNQVAKHASKDDLRSLNEEKRSFEGKYLNPSPKRFQTAMVISDVHDFNADAFTMQCFLDTVERIKPENIVLNGDIYDFPEFGKYTVDPREWAVSDRLAFVYTLLGKIRTRAPNSQIDFNEGNHEFRLLRHLGDTGGQIKSVMSEYHGWTISRFLKLDEFGINYHARADLGVFSERDLKSELRNNYVILNDQVLFHHFPEGQRMGLPGAHGHHHKHLVWTGFTPVNYGVFEWHQMGCAHVRNASYTNGEIWGNGFMIVHMDTVKKKTQFEYIDTSHEHCVIGGKYYLREDLQKA